MNDNIAIIYEKYKSLFIKQKENFGVVFINFNSSLCEKYIDLNYKMNIDNLFYIKELIGFMKSNNKQYEIGKDIDKLIHETGLILSKEHKLKNIEILNFISNDDYYNSIKYKKK